jgi:hypothetical protein
VLFRLPLKLEFREKIMNRILDLFLKFKSSMTSVNDAAEFPVIGKR